MKYQKKKMREKFATTKQRKSKSTIDALKVYSKADSKEKSGTTETTARNNGAMEGSQWMERTNVDRRISGQVQQATACIDLLSVHATPNCWAVLG